MIPACWPPPPDTPIGEPCARELVAHLKTVMPPAIAFCRDLIRQRMPGVEPSVHGLTMRQIAATTLHPDMSGLAIASMSTGNMGTTLTVGISLKRDGSLAWRWVLPVEQGNLWHRIREWE